MVAPLMPRETARMGGAEQQIALAALCLDPRSGPAAPAQTLPLAIPNRGVNLNAVLYQASGAGPHPTVLLLHGLPEIEQNLDCAQSIRRAGWNVLAIHYRGSWGGPGTFTFAHCLEDAAASLDWLQEPANGERLRIDPQRIVLIGHSMGGFVGAFTLPGAPRPSRKCPGIVPARTRLRKTRNQKLLSVGAGGYAVSEALRWQVGRDWRLLQAKSFHAVMAAVMLAAGNGRIMGRLTPSRAMLAAG